MIYSTSLFELALWIVGLLLFITSPSTMYLIWVLVIHIFKAIMGFIVLNKMPKTYEIIENLAKNPNFEEDKVMELVQAQIRETFMERWSENKNKLLIYLITTIIALLIDIVIFIVQIVVFGSHTWNLLQTSLLFIILIFIGKIFLILILVSDVVYFLWFITISFSFPDYMIEPIKKAIFGSMTELKSLVYSIFRKQKDESVIN